MVLISYPRQSVEKIHEHVSSTYRVLTKLAVDSVVLVSTDYLLSTCQEPRRATKNSRNCRRVPMSPRHERVPIEGFRRVPKNLSNKWVCKIPESSELESRKRHEDFQSCPRSPDERVLVSRNVPESPETIPKTSFFCLYSIWQCKWIRIVRLLNTYLKQPASS